MLDSTTNHGTYVCHYFAREWAKMGYNVRVVHCQAIYPAPFYWVARFAQKIIAAHTGSVVYTYADNQIHSYAKDNVHITRIPVFKPYPHTRFTAKSIDRATAFIHKEMQNADFVPDIIVGHFPNPQLELISNLRQYYPEARTGLVLHLIAEIAQLQHLYKTELSSLMSNIDCWGFRYPALQKAFKQQFGAPKLSFLCYSGVPANFITTNNTHTGIRHHTYLFVGELINRKHPETVLDALLLTYPNKDFTLKYIGEGNLRKQLEKRIKQEKLDTQVSFLGHINRESIVAEYDKADAMIMVSEGEAFGLVYLEAMSRGCVPFASLNEGMDGLIIHEKNGYLSKAGDAKELAQNIKRFISLDKEGLVSISNNAIRTAKSLTDTLAAKQYIEHFITK